jgi:hypothetical protein
MVRPFLRSAISLQTEAQIDLDPPGDGLVAQTRRFIHQRHATSSQGQGFVGCPQTCNRLLSTSAAIEASGRILIPRLISTKGLM